MEGPEISTSYLYNRLRNYRKTSLMKSIKTILVLPFLGLIKLYQLVISPWLGPSCRYTPTCSQYAIEALNKYGPFKGIWLTLKRVVRCNPWGGQIGRASCRERV